MMRENRQHRVRFQSWPYSQLAAIQIGDSRETALHCTAFSPADDYTRDRINLTKELVPNPDYTEIVRTQGDCCLDRGILDGSLVLVDFSQLPHQGDLVYVRCLERGDTIRVFHTESGKIELRSANKEKDYPPLKYDGEIMRMRGVVIQIITNPRTCRP